MYCTPPARTLNQTLHHRMGCQIADVCLCRFLQHPRTRDKQSHWWAYQPKVVLPGSEVMPQQVCMGDAYIDKFIVSRGSAAINANSTQAFRALGILSVQARCSDGTQLGYFGPSPSDASVNFKEENIVVGITSLSLICDPSMNRIANLMHRLLSTILPTMVDLSICRPGDA